MKVNAWLRLSPSYDTNAAVGCFATRQKGDKRELEGLLTLHPRKGYTA